MPNRPYKCTLCHAVFKTESGRRWHIAHRHEVPAALDTLARDYEARTTDLQQDNANLSTSLNQIQRDLKASRVSLMREMTAELEARIRIQHLEADIRKMAIELVARDHVLKVKLGIELPNPFTPSTGGDQSQG